jgi:dihydropteroate synthase
MITMDNKQTHMNYTKIGNTEFHWGERTYVMGIINMSPESFSGDGITGIKSAVEQAKRFANEGADILDIGGMSTKPGLPEINPEEEMQRVIPLIEKLSGKINIPISIDTCRYEVAQRALDSGAVILNDQWGLKKEPRLGELAASRNVPIILMSNQRDIGGYDIATGRDTASYANVMKVVTNNIQSSIEKAQEAGIPSENIIIDPGIGFGHTWQQDIELIRNLKELKKLSKPILLGTSRKSLIKMVLNLPPDERIEGTAATVAISIANGADIVRVHDVKQMVRVCRMTDAIVRGTY